MRKLLLAFVMLPAIGFSQYNVAYTVTILRLKAKADACDGGAPFCLNAPQDPIFNIWTTDGQANENTNCWIYEDDPQAEYNLWIDIQNLEIANETGVNTSYVSFDMSGFETDALFSATCSPSAGDDAVFNRQFVEQFDFSTIPEGIPYIDIVNLQDTYYAEFELIWTDLNAGLLDLENNLSFSVAPNPSNGNFAVKFAGTDVQEFDVQVMDLAGRVVFSDHVNSNSKEIQLNEEAGIYLVQVTVGDKAGMRKIMIQ